MFDIRALAHFNFRQFSRYRNCNPVCRQALSTTVLIVLKIDLNNLFYVKDFCTPPVSLFYFCQIFMWFVLFSLSWSALWNSWACFVLYMHRKKGGGIMAAESVECVTPAQKVVDSIPTPYWLGQCRYNVIGWDWSHCLLALSLRQLINLSGIDLGIRTRDSLVADEDVKKPSKQNNHRH